MQFYCFQYSRLVFNAVLLFPMQLYSFQCSFSVYNTVFFSIQSLVFNAVFYISMHHLSGFFSAQFFTVLPKRSSSPTPKSFLFYQEDSNFSGPIKHFLLYFISYSTRPFESLFFNFTSIKL